MARDLGSRHHGSMTPTVRRWLRAWLASVALVAAVTVVIKILAPHGPAHGLAVIYIVVVLAVAVRWGPGFAFVASLLSASAFEYFFLGPQYASVLPDLAGGEAFAAFLATAVAASLLASRLRRQVREAARLGQEQEALRRVASLVAREEPPVGVFTSVATEVGLLFGVEIALFARHDPDGFVTVLAQWGTIDTGAAAGSRWPLAEPLPVASPQRLDWATAGSEWDVALGPFGQAARASGIRSSIVSPVVIEGSPWGFLLVETRRSVLAEDSAARMGDFSELVATAVKNAEAQAQLRASRARIVAAADETRRRIERDLHDGAQQRLVSLSLKLRAVEAAVPLDRDDIRTELSGVADGLVNLLEELREMSRGLHPAILAEGGLGRALKALSRRSPVAVELDVSVARRLPQQVEVTAYYVVSELLTNAAKHAGASSVHVGVYAPEKVLLLSVADDGTGGADPARGSGLIGLRDRVEAIGGTISVRSPLGSGTRVNVEVPILVPRKL
jgi:signal transduction histidine kinase